MTPPPSISKESVGTKIISRFLSDLSAVCTGASQSFRPESAEATIEESKTAREKVKHKVFQAFPQLHHVKDLGILSDEEVNQIMPAEALEDLDKSLGRFLGKAGVSRSSNYVPAAFNTARDSAKFQIAIDAEKYKSTFPKWYYVYARIYSDSIEFRVYGLVEGVTMT